MKKQIAVLMAAATAVTTVAPVLASADTNKYDASTSEIVKKITDALNTRYKDKTADGIQPSRANAVDGYANSRYAVILATTKNLTDEESKYDIDSLGGNEYYGTKATNLIVDRVNELKSKEDNDIKSNSNFYVIKDASKVQGLIESLVIGQQDKSNVKVLVIDKGFKDGSATETMTQKHYVISDANVDTQVNLSELAKDLYENMNNNTGKTYVDKLKVNGVDYNKNTQPVSKVELTLKSGKEYTLEQGDKAFDLLKPVDKNGNDVEISTANEQSVLDTIEGFKYQDNHDDKEETVVLPLGDSSVYTVQDVMASTIELGKIFTNKDGYTKEGESFVNSIIKARMYKNNSHEFNYNGVNYTMLDNNMDRLADGSVPSDSVFFGDGDHKDLAPKIEKVSDGYVLRFNVNAVNENSGLSGVTLQFVIKGDNQKDLAIVLSNLRGDNTVVSGHFTRLQGANRYATAVAVSQERFETDEASSVVIVGGEALMDGLSAVPLATAKNAPILLSDPKNGLSEATLNEISRACKGLNRKTVYVVGGTNSVPEKAVKQLEEKFGAVVLRVSGSDRFDTSLEVAKRLGYDGNLETKSTQTTKVSNVDQKLVNAETEAKKIADSAKEALDDANQNRIDANARLVEANEAATDNPDATGAEKTRIDGNIANAENDVELKEKAYEAANINYKKAKKAYDVAVEARMRAEKVSVLTTTGNIYIVGGDGAADAMSISPVAARVNNGKVSPILVVPKTGLKRSTRDFIKNFEGEKFLIGGESVLSSDVYRDINGSKVGGSVVRISGSNRFDTNVQIIKDFYGEGNAIEKVGGAIFASGDNKYLVDSQTAGPLAAKENAPIVLTGSKLTDDQVNLLKKNGVLDGVKTNVYQVGGVVSSDVMSVVVDKLGL